VLTHSRGGPATAAIKKIFYGWWIVLGCFLISLYCGSIIFYELTAFIEPLVKEFDWSYTQVSFAASLRGMEMGIFAPMVGFLVDRFGSRKLIFCGVIVVGFGLILLSTTQSLAMFYGAFLLLALGGGGVANMVTITVVANWFRKKLGLALGVMMSGFGASGFLVPLIVRLIDAYGWRNALVILGLGIWVLGILLSLIIREKPEHYGYLPDGAVTVDATTDCIMQHDEVEIAFKEGLRKKSYWYLNISETLRLITLTAVVTHIMPYLGTVGMQRTMAGLVAGAVPVMSIIGRFSFGWLGDIFDKRYMMAAAISCVGLGMVAFNFMQATWAVFLFLLLFAPGYGGSMVLRGTILREYFGRKSLGKMLGITMGCTSIGGLIGPTLAGWVFDTLGSYHLVWVVFSGLMGLAMGLILKMK
jgi:MFS family permease